MSRYGYGLGAKLQTLDLDDPIKDLRSIRCPLSMAEAAAPKLEPWGAAAPKPESLSGGRGGSPEPGGFGGGSPQTGEHGGQRQPPKPESQC